jgi:hypothetical protein
MIKNGEPNPLNVFEVRRVKAAAPHFEYVNIPMKYNLEQSLINWIERNLKNRYYIGRNVSLDDNNKILQVITVGFEETKDMSYFMLACPYLKYN